MKSSKYIVKIALMVAVMIVCSLVSIYIANIPMTLQVFAVALTGYMMGVGGIWVVVVYLILGMIGVPIFSGCVGGLASLVGPSGGYLVGFLILVLGTGCTRRKTIAEVVVLSFLALVILYVLGIAGYALSTGVDVALAILSNVWYMPKDIVLMILAYVLAKRLDKIIKE